MECDEESEALRNSEIQWEISFEKRAGLRYHFFSITVPWDICKHNDLAVV